MASRTTYVYRPGDPRANENGMVAKQDDRGAVDASADKLVDELSTDIGRVGKPAEPGEAAAPEKSMRGGPARGNRGPRQDRAKGEQFQNIAVWSVVLLVLCIAVPAAYFYRHGGHSRWLLEWLVGLLPLFTPALFLVLFFGKRMYQFFWEQGERHLMPLADEVMAKDPRPPIVFLRSFNRETQLRAQEKALATIFEPAGPFIAVGNPADELPHLGAYRFYVADEDWQDFVSELVSRAALVILIAGSTEGVRWEITQCARLVPARRLLVLIPSVASYDEFRRQIESDTNIRIPLSIETSVWRVGKLVGMLRFGDDWVGRFMRFETPTEWKLASLDWSRHKLLTANLARDLTPVAADLQLKLAAVEVPYDGSLEVRLLRYAVLGSVFVLPSLYLLYQGIVRWLAH